jgi:surface antigen
VQLANRNRLLTLLALLALAPAVWCSDWTSLTKDQALADFNEQDWQDYLKTVTALLDAPQPAADRSLPGALPRLSSGWTIRPVPRVAGFDECRRVRTSVYSSKHKATTRTWTACRASDGEWSLTKGT